jgi:SPX domain protein involved in polyphosphate accumulation
VILSSSSEYRYERKFLVNRLSREEVESIVRLHPAIFREIFHQRFVNNIYLDSCKLINYYDNIEGQRRRKKARIRWYDNLFGEITKPVLEIKVKNGELGRKISRVLEPFEISQGIDLTSVCSLNQDILHSSLPGIGSLVPTLLNRYSRKYFISNDGLYRITVDSDQSFSRIYGRGSASKNHVKDHKSVVLEVKYSREQDMNAHTITSRFPFRMTKNSKYISGMQQTSQDLMC